MLWPIVKDYVYNGVYLKALMFNYPYLDIMFLKVCPNWISNLVVMIVFFVGANINWFVLSFI